MATFDYAEMQDVADELITEFGQVGTITRNVPPDPVLGGDPVPTPYSAKMVPMTYDQRYVNGTSILSTDRQIYISSVGLAIVPSVGDVVATADGTQYLIVDGDRNNYDGVTPVVHIVQGRTS